eukprot:TRINITY_DN18256_c0_g2_i2.p1 TRINITY_DN18256_c0_g2~~TRINITY_DN18256_c0_g2_i2.p1  ORF type:complete len:573 (-),score=201.59 TRINITY_DN18256_c0_g2_i2:334-2052(-)
MCIRDRYQRRVRGVACCFAMVSVLPPDDRLRRASAQGDVNSIKAALQEGASVNATGGYLRTALHFAIAKEPDNVEEVVDLLVSHQAAVNVRDKGGSCPLHLASESGLCGAVQTLLDQGAEVNAKDDVYGRTALHWAAESGNEAVVVALLQAGADPVLKDAVKEGSTPLEVAKTARISGLLLDAMQKPEAPQRTADAYDAGEELSGAQARDEARKAELEQMKADLEGKRNALEARRVAEASLVAEMEAEPPIPPEADPMHLQVQESGSDKLAARLKNLGEVFSKAQAEEAQKYKVLQSILTRMGDDLAGEKMIVEDRFNWFSREVKLTQNHTAMDINVLKQSRAEMDKTMHRQIAEKVGVLQSDLAHERELREEGEQRSILPPSIIPSLADKVDLAGDVRYDRGEQLMRKIDGAVENMQNMLAVETSAHKEITDFMANIEAKCLTLRTELEEEKRYRQQAEARHGKRMDTLRSLPPMIVQDDERRHQRREHIQARISEEMGKMLQYIRAEQGSRTESDSSVMTMFTTVADKLEDEILEERKLREGSEEKFFALLQGTCDRARDQVEAIAHWKP